MNDTEEMAWNAPGSNSPNSSGSGGNKPSGGEDNPWARRGHGGGGGGFRGGGRGPEEWLNDLRNRFKGPFFAGPAGIIGLIVGLWLLSGFYTVDDAERAVVMTFGSSSGSQGPGLHWHFPYPLQHVTKVNVGGIRNIADRAVMLTQDENLVDLEIAAQYKVGSAEDFLFRVRDPELTLAQALKGAVREVTGQEKMDFILTEGREEIETRIHEILQATLDSYQSGLTVTEVNLKDAQPPEAVQNAFADAIRAREDKQRLQNEAEAYANDILPKARGAAARKSSEAEAYREKVVAEAEGQAQRFDQLLAEYSKAPQVTRKRLYLDAMQTVLSNSSKVVVDGDSGNMTVLPLEQLLKRGSVPPMAPSMEMTPSAHAATTPAAPTTDGARSRSRTRE